MNELAAKIQCQRGEDFLLDVDTSIPLQGVTGIYGPSGCGKTSLLYCLAGLLDVASSTEVYLNEDCWQAPARHLPTEQRGIGVVFQDAQLFPHLSVRGNLNFALQRCHRVGGPSLQQVCQWLALEPFLERGISELSRGQQQRVAIARSLLNSPVLLLLDEPLANIDLTSRQEIMQHLQTINRELAIPMVYVSHSMEELAQLADRLLVMEAGKIIAEGSTVDLSSRLELAIAHEEQAAAIVEATLSQHDLAYGLSELELEGQTLFIAHTDAAQGSISRLRIPARDVSLCLEPPGQTSILNVLRCTVAEIEPGAQSRSLVRLQLGQQFLLARLTRKSIDRLNLREGMTVYAQIKSVALLGETIA